MIVQKLVTIKLTEEEIIAGIMRLLSERLPADMYYKIQDNTKSLDVVGNDFYLMVDGIVEEVDCTWDNNDDPRD